MLRILVVQNVVKQISCSSGEHRSNIKYGRTVALFLTAETAVGFLFRVTVNGISILAFSSAALGPAADIDPPPQI